MTQSRMKEEKRVGGGRGGQKGKHLPFERKKKEEIEEEREVVCCCEMREDIFAFRCLNLNDIVITLSTNSDTKTSGQRDRQTNHKPFGFIIFLICKSGQKKSVTQPICVYTGQVKCFLP
jgi:hypothetical protein